MPSLHTYPNSSSQRKFILNLILDQDCTVRFFQVLQVQQGSSASVFSAAQSEFYYKYNELIIFAVSCFFVYRLFYCIIDFIKTSNITTSTVTIHQCVHHKIWHYNFYVMCECVCKYT